MSSKERPAARRISSANISRLKQERERRGWTQSHVAERLGTTQANVSRWENGDLPGLYYRQKLGELFGKSLEELGLVLNAEEQGKEYSIPPAPLPPSSQQPFWNIPYRRNPLFTGREEILSSLNALYTVFSSNKVTSQTQIRAISGLGGIGKTQIAVEYAYRYRDRYQAILWVTASSHAALVADFVMLATSLGLPEQHEQDQDTVVRAVRRWFDAHNDWLLILDDVDNLEMVVDFLPAHGAGEVLLTTRLQALGTVAQRIGVEKMGLDEGVMFLLRRTKVIAPGILLDQAMEESQAQAMDIVTALDGLPLALDQAGAYIEETSCGLPQYFHLYATRRKELLLRRGRFPIDHPDSVASTWSLSFQQVEQESPAAAELLRLLAFLDPEAIPEEIITMGAIELGPTLGAVANDPLQADAIIALLLRYSLIRRASEKKLLSIHHLVQEVLRDGMDGDTQRLWAERTIRAVYRAFPEVEPQAWQLQIWQPQTLERCQRCLPHVLRCITSSEEYELAFSEAARLFNEAASYLGAHARYKQAEFLLLRTLEIRQKVLEAHHPDIARTLNDLGLLYLNSGKYKQAKPLLQDALAVRQQVLGEGHPDVAQTLYNLASLYRTLGDYVNAEPLFLRSLHIREVNLGADSPLVGQCCYGLARLYLSQGKYYHAESFCEQSLRIRKQSLGENHPMLASTLNVLAKIYQGQHKLDLAEKMNWRALRIRESFSGEDHPHVATIVNSLIEIYHAEGKYQEAEPLISRSLEIHKKLLGLEHPYIAYSFSNQAENFFLQGDYIQAESFYKKALVVREQRLGLDHPRTASTYDDLARLYSVLGRYEDAEAFYHKALLIRERTFGHDHVVVVSTLEQYARVLRMLKKESEADELEVRIRTIRSK